MDKITKLPKISQSEVIQLMDSGNISRFHLGMDPLPYMWYKKLTQLSKIHAVKYLGHSELNFIMEYCSSTRKERRTIPFIREKYLLIIRILLLRVENERLTKECQNLDNKIKKKQKVNHGRGKRNHTEPIF